MRLTRAVTLVVTFAAVASVGLTARQATTTGEVKTLSATIEAIDYTSRLVTLKTPDGKTETIVVPPAIERFPALKVGDTVTFRYHESLVLMVRKAGEAAAGTKVTDPTLVRTPGEKPGGTLSQQITVTVTIVEIDPKVPSITIKTDAGQVISRRVQDPKKLEGLKAGDRIEITYTEAIAVSVTSR